MIEHYGTLIDTAHEAIRKRLEAASRRGLRTTDSGLTSP
jgi:hypothetical protein